MESAGDGFSVAVITLLLVAGMAATQDKEIQENLEEKENGFVLEWSPDETTTEYAYLLEVYIGQTTECEVSSDAEGKMRHESGLGTYSHTVYGDDDFFLTGSTRRGEVAAAHAGPIGTTQVTGPVVGEFGSWNSRFGGGTSSDLTFWRLMGAFDLTFHEGMAPHVRVACDSDDAGVRLYLAQEVVPITSSAATGGAGFDLNLGERVGVNIEDHFDLSTRTDLVMLHMHEISCCPGTLPSTVEGEIRIRTPGGDEAVPIETDDFGWFLLREWDQPGRYSLELERRATNRIPLAGIMADFRLEAKEGLYSV